MSHPHRRGKIARLPEHLRNLVNRMLADGAEYKFIIAELEKHRHQWPPGVTAFNKVNIHQWRHGGYEEWRTRQELHEERRAHRQETFDFLRDTGDLDRAVPQIAKLQLFDVLFHANTQDLADKVGGDPTDFVRTLNALLRLRNG